MRVDDQLLNAQLELLSSDPTAGKKGRVYFNTTTGKPRFDNGSAFANFDGVLPDTDNARYVANLGLAASVAGNALTVSVKGKNGSDPDSGSNIVYCAMRNATVTTGTYSNRTIQAALSVTVSSGSTLGHGSGRNEYVWVYLIDNAGTLELAVAGSRVFDELTVQSTTAEGGAGAADSRYTLYSTTARSNVPIRLIGRIKVNQATAGTWASAPSEISLLPTQHTMEYSEVIVSGGNGFGSTNTRIRRFTSTELSVGSAITYADSATNGGTFTINEEGVYFIQYNDTVNGSNTTYGVTLNSAELTTTITNVTTSTRLIYVSAASGHTSPATWIGRLYPGDIVRGHGTTGTYGTTDDEVRFRIVKLRD